jgi:ribosomal protein S18 acetylase RimI-like enzyme
MTLRELRLQALTDAPDAFGSTIERERARTVDDWRRWISPGATFIVDTEDGPRGIVEAARDSTDPSIVHLMAMWVHPALRARGAGDALVNDVIAWAHAEGARIVRLLVIEHNQRARRFYERLGFRPTGRTRVRERDAAIEIEMERAVSAGT